MDNCQSEPSALTLEQETLIAHEDRLIALERRLAMNDNEHPLKATIEARVEQLAITPPGPQANSMAADIVALLQAALSNPVVKAILPQSWAPYVAAIVVILGLVSAAGFVGYKIAPTPAPIIVEKPVEPKPPIIINVPPVVTPTPSPTPSPSPSTACLNPTGCLCGCVTTWKCTCKDCDHPMLKKPDPIGPPITPPITPTAQTNKIVLYQTSAGEGTKLLTDPLLKGLPITVDATEYAKGMVYNFGGKEVAMPCAAVIDSTGKVLNVVTFSTAADVAALVKGK